LELSRHPRIKENPWWDLSVATARSPFWAWRDSCAPVEIDGELHQLVETESSVVGCHGCGIRALSKGRRRTTVRDLSCGGRPVVVVWAKRLWRCGDADCDVKTPSETSRSSLPGRR
jgi:hypothetical protein